MSSAQRVLSHLLTQSQPVSRPEIALACDLSRPTVFAAVERLTELGLVTDVGQRVGLPGRSASLYEVADQAGTAVGVDIGGSNIRVSLTDARGRQLAETRQPTSATGGAAIAQQVVNLVRQVTDRHALPGRARPAWWESRSPASSTPTAPPCTTPGTSGRRSPFDLRTPLREGAAGGGAAGQQRQPRRRRRAVAGRGAAAADVRRDRGRCGRRRGHRARGAAPAGRSRSGRRGRVPAAVPGLPPPPRGLPRRGGRPDPAEEGAAAGAVGRTTGHRPASRSCSSGQRPARHQESRSSRRRAGGSPPSPPRSAPSSTPRRSSSPAVSVRTRPWWRAPASWSTQLAPFAPAVVRSAWATRPASSGFVRTRERLVAAAGEPHATGSRSHCREPTRVGRVATPTDRVATDFFFPHPVAEGAADGGVPGQQRQPRRHR